MKFFTKNAEGATISKVSKPEVVAPTKGIGVKSRTTPREKLPKGNASNATNKTMIVKQANVAMNLKDGIVDSMVDSEGRTVIYYRLGGKIYHFIKDNEVSNKTKRS